MNLEDGGFFCPSGAPCSMLPWVSVSHTMRILNLCLYVSQKLGVKINTKSAWKAKKLLYCMIVLLLLLLIYLDNEFPLV